MDLEQRLAVLDDGEAVDGGRAEHVAPQRRTAVIRREA